MPESNLTECIVCGDKTEQTCTWCEEPLHRHDSEKISQGIVDFSLCWQRHVIDCEVSDDVE